MVSAGLVQTKGSGSTFCFRMWARMVSWKPATEVKTPRRMALRVRAEKKFSTASSHEPEVGVKWNTQRE